MSHRKFGDRKDGRYLRNLSPYNAVTPFIMRQRSDSQNYFKCSVEVSEALNYIRQKRKEGFEKLGFLHLFVAAYVRMLSQCPALNRFVSGQRIYARNSIEFVMTVKKEMRAEAEETSIKVTFEPTDTIKEVYEKMQTAISNVKDSTEENATDATARILMRMPRIILRFAVIFLEFLDYFGLLPQFLLNVSPFHGSMIVTNMASLGIPPIYHHIYNFGNLPVFVSFGAKRRKYEVSADGAVSEKTYIDFAVVTDERICDGFNYAKGFKYLTSYIKDPYVLDIPPEKVITDVC